MKKKTAPVPPYRIMLQRFTDNPTAQLAFPLGYAGYWIGSPASPLHNPFKVKGKKGIRHDSGTEKFAEYLFEEMWKEGPVQDALIQCALHVQQKGRLDLVCFCDVEGGDVCHGYIIAEAIEKLIRDGIV